MHIQDYPYETVEYDNSSDRYKLVIVDYTDCNTYQCRDHEFTTFVRWLTDEEVAARYPHLNQP